MLRDVVDLMEKQAGRSVRRVAAGLSKDLKAGWGFHDALERQGKAFPPLFVALVSVGEESGNLPQVLGHLEEHYVVQQRLRRTFLSQIAWPVFQLVAATLVIAALIYALSLIAPSQASNPGEALAAPVDPLGLGLAGRRGAFLILGAVFGSTLLGLLTFGLVWQLFGDRVWFQWSLQHLPALGPCLRALALTRLCTALSLMLETRVSAMKTLRLAFLATGNATFIHALPRAEAALRQGNTFTTSLKQARSFPVRFLSAVAIAEEGGHLPEILRRQAEEYQDQADRKLALLNQLASWFVWVLVAVVIASAIFRIYQVVYLRNLNRVIDPPHRLEAPVGAIAPPTLVVEDTGVNRRGSQQVALARWTA